jgi:hypothetical protein
MLIENVWKIYQPLHKFRPNACRQFRSEQMLAPFPKKKSRISKYASKAALNYQYHDNYEDDDNDDDEDDDSM